MKFCNNKICNLNMHCVKTKTKPKKPNQTNNKKPKQQQKTFGF